MINRPIVKRIQYAFQMKLVSPLNVSGGYGKSTDCDVLCSYDGEPFIPGTTLAGAFRAYLREENYDENQIHKLLGTDEQEDGWMSRLQISDMFFKSADVIVRDGVRLENKVAVSMEKFDMQAVDAGAQCKGYMLLTIREEDDEAQFDCMIKECIRKLGCGDIRIGTNKNRGYGQMEVMAVRKKEFDKNNINEWLKFDKVAWAEDQDESDKINLLPVGEDDRFITLRVPLRQRGGISIREYSAKPDMPDYKHITSNGEPVIPGTSWNGAIRGRIGELLNQIVPEKKQKLLEEWFGYVRKHSGEAYQSRVIISESEIDGGTDLVMTRNSVDRFTAASISGALYTERAHFNGKLKLEIKVRKKYYDEKRKLYIEDASRYEALTGMLLLAVKDIQEGYLAVGGQTAVGRGIFEADGKLILLGTEKSEGYFLNAVLNLKNEREMQG